MTDDLPRPIPEWERQRCALIWPSERRPHLVHLFRDIVRSISRVADVTVFAVETASLSGLRADLSQLDIEVSPDIWIQDFAPIPVQLPSGRIEFVKFIYNPRYLADVPEASSIDDSFGAGLGNRLSIPTVHIPLRIDGGSLVFTGEGIAIGTERIISDNRLEGKRHIEDVLMHRLGIKQLIIVPEEPHDITGHIDGMVRFVDDRTVLIGSYPEKYRAGHRYGELLRELIGQALGHEYMIVRVQNSMPSDESCEGLMSAVGNRLNFIQCGKTLFLPLYGSPEEDSFVESLNADLPSFRIQTLNGCIPLARLGGVLHCVSWQW